MIRTCTVGSLPLPLKSYFVRLPTQKRGLFLDGSVKNDTAIVSLSEFTRTSSYGDLSTSSGSLSGMLGRIWSEKGCKQRSNGDNSHLSSKISSQPRVGILCDQNSDFVSALYGVWLAGGIAVPLCSSHPLEEQMYVVNDSTCSCIISSDHFNERAEQISKLCYVPVLKLTEELLKPKSTRSSSDQQNESSILDSNRGSMLVYTSGTTGKPKGALLTHGNISAQVSMLLNSWGWSSDDVALHTLPLHHIHGIVNTLLCPLTIGATCVMLPKFDPMKVWECLLHRVDCPAVNVFMAVPTIYAKLVEFYEDNFTTRNDREWIHSHLTSNIRLMVSGSAPLPRSLFEKWEKLSGHSLLERYGMTEVGMVLSNHLNGPRIPGSVGNPLPTVRVRIDSKASSGEHINADSVTEGYHEQVGELLVKGPAVFQGYWGKEEETKNAFNEDGWFKTGDIVMYRSERFTILGRASTDIIKSRGYKISALEIEQVLLDHPAIKECAVFGVPDDTYGEIITVAIVLQETSDVELNIKNIKDFCLPYLAKYKIPQRLVIVDELRRNAMGKINKKQLLMDLKV